MPRAVPCFPNRGPSVVAPCGLSSTGSNASRRLKRCFATRCPLGAQMSLYSRAFVERCVTLVPAIPSNFLARCIPSKCISLFFSSLDGARSAGGARFSLTVSSNEERHISICAPLTQQVLSANSHGRLTSSNKRFRAPANDWLNDNTIFIHGAQLNKL